MGLTNSESSLITCSGANAQDGIILRLARRQRRVLEFRGLCLMAWLRVQGVESRSDSPSCHPRSQLPVWGDKCSGIAAVGVVHGAMLTKHRTPRGCIDPTRYSAHYRNDKCSEVYSV